MVMNEHVKNYEARVLTINAEKERYLEELLKIKSDQVEQYDSINTMQAELEKKTKEIKEKEKRLQEQLAELHGNPLGIPMQQNGLLNTYDGP